MIEIQVSGAGAGKTYGIAQQIVERYDPESHKDIFAITYTNAAAKNIANAIIDQLGYLPDNIKVSTIHTFLLNEIIYPYSPFVLNEVYTTSSRCALYSNFPQGKPAEQKARESRGTIKRLKEQGIIHVEEAYSAARRVVDKNHSRNKAKY